MKIIDTLRRAVRNMDRSTQSLAELVEGLANQSNLLNQRLQELIEAHANLADDVNDKLDMVIEYQKATVALLQAQSAIITALGQTFANKIGQSINVPKGDVGTIQSPPRHERQGKGAPSFREAMKRIPLLLDEKTYNTSHPDYDARSVRNYPGHIFNRDKPCSNLVYQELSKLANGDEVPDKRFDEVLGEALVEARTIPYAEQVFKRKKFIEAYVAELERKYHAHYMPGWVNLDDALFLYWLVRRLKPKTIVQTGVCNGLSTAFMMLGLAKNGSDGRLHAIDLPPIFDPNDPAWTVKEKVYGVVIPEGKSSGWLVPDAYRSRFEVWKGDAKVMMPKIVDQVNSIDMFYHDSDHTYNHMMFEFREARRKLASGGLIVADDVSWNASLWDFADEAGVPSYNFKGAVGVAFF